MVERNGSELQAVGGKKKRVRIAFKRQSLDSIRDRPRYVGNAESHSEIATEASGTFKALININSRSLVRDRI